MSKTLFTQNVIAVIWDFDKTLIPGYMQEPLFRRFGLNKPEDQKKFWDEVNGLEKFYIDRGASHVSRDTMYLNHLLTYVRRGIFKNLSNQMLRQLGGEIELFQGLPDFFGTLKEIVSSNAHFQKHDVELEHYIVSTGLKEMILGSKVAPFVDGIWACEFVEVAAEPGYLETKQQGLFEKPTGGVVVDVCYSLDNTTKTRAIFEINKGVNKEASIDVNDTIAQEDRRVPFEHMIYIADGASDVPVFSILNQYNGRTFAVYPPGDKKHFCQVKELQRQGRVQGIGEASYVNSSLTSLWLQTAVEEIAASIVAKQERLLREKVGRSPKHILPERETATQKPTIATKGDYDAQTAVSDSAQAPPSPPK
jgi:hypothetical protein